MSGAPNNATSASPADRLGHRLLADRLASIPSILDGMLSRGPAPLKPATLASTHFIVTGTGNAYTAPEVSGGSDGNNWSHVIAHTIVGFILPVFTWIIGSVILFVTKRVAAR